MFPAVAPDAADTGTPAADGLDDARAIVHAITAAWPQPVSVADLARTFRARHPDAADEGVVPRRLAEDSGWCVRRRCGRVPPARAAARGNAPAKRPAASDVARAQVAAGTRVTNLWHENVDLDDACARQLIALCDGTRDRRALVAALGHALPDAAGNSPEMVLERYLEQLVRLALLTA